MPGDFRGKLPRELGPLEQPELFDIDVAVTTAGKQKVSFQKGAAVPELTQSFITH
jgi:hypothetical protein